MDRTDQSWSETWCFLGGAFDFLLEGLWPLPPVRLESRFRLDGMEVSAGREMVGPCRDTGGGVMRLQT